jgi:hypothetical protein
VSRNSKSLGDPLWSRFSKCYSWSLTILLAPFLVSESRKQVIGEDYQTAGGSKEGKTLLLPSSPQLSASVRLWACRYVIRCLLPQCFWNLNRQT